MFESWVVKKDAEILKVSTYKSDFYNLQTDFFRLSSEQVNSHRVTTGPLRWRDWKWLYYFCTLSVQESDYHLSFFHISDGYGVL